MINDNHVYQFKVTIGDLIDRLLATEVALSEVLEDSEDLHDWDESIIEIVDELRIDLTKNLIKLESLRMVSEKEQENG